MAPPSRQFGLRAARETLIDPDRRLRVSSRMHDPNALRPRKPRRGPLAVEGWRGHRARGDLPETLSRSPAAFQEGVALRQRIELRLLRAAVGVGHGLEQVIESGIWILAQCAIAAAE